MKKTQNIKAKKKLTDQVLLTLIGEMVKISLFRFPKQTSKLPFVGIVERDPASW